MSVVLEGWCGNRSSALGWLGVGDVFLQKLVIPAQNCRFGEETSD
ncbi:hypothetical protein [Pseudomonas atacamensis]|nr:hypothetical protein [Pseudomonas atacamensis]